MKAQLPQTSVTLTVLPASFHLFTTVLQSGIEVKTSTTAEMRTFLCQMPGFTADYISNTVETIFLDGTPVDDLSLFFTGENHVLALSAAMPGLAGAIFRKNSIHSALRTQTDSSPRPDSNKQTTTVTVKLFNSIAKERGGFLLQEGVTIKAAKVLTFLQKRTGLEDFITAIELNSKTVNRAILFDKLPEFHNITLRVKTTNDC